MARQVFVRFKALVTEPAAFAYAERHDNIEAIYKKLKERRDTADVTELLKELHRIVNEAIRAQAPGEDQAEGLDVFDLSTDRPREAARRVREEGHAQGHGASGHPGDRRGEAGADARANPLRMDYYRKYPRSSPTTTARRTA